MNNNIKLYNTLTREKEAFAPNNSPFVGMYVCGPTVYGDPHLGHARPAITFDLLFRYLTYGGYKVRYVRNITDVGHLENDADEGDDKLAKKAKAEQLEPMEVAQRYTLSYHKALETLNCLPPSIEPRATGHIPEQIEMIEKIQQNGFAYEANGSVYFDVERYNKEYRYGKLSGRIVEDLEAGAGNDRRELKEQQEKKSPNDFALWKKAAPQHIMRWNSPWGAGFPGWHIECSAMSKKYLGDTFDIHGGGLDLLFPHHECEIAQSNGANGNDPVRYWMHCNMITINGQKMGKSLGNGIALSEFFSGDHALLAQAYGPMTVRFFMLQAHYRSTLDFSNEALQAADKGYQRLMNAYALLKDMKPAGFATTPGTEATEINKLLDECFDYMNDDLNTAEVISRLFELTKKINSYKEGHLQVADLDETTFNRLKEVFTAFIKDILAIEETGANSAKDATEDLMKLILELRYDVRAKKDYASSDKIRDALLAIGIQVKDGKDGASWSYN